MRILAFDAALARLGDAVLDGEHVVLASSFATNPKETLAERLAGIYRLVDQHLTLWHPDLVLVEAPGGWTRGSDRSRQHTVEVLAKVRGAILAAAGMRGVAAEEMEVGEARKWFCGKASANKSYVQCELALLLRAQGETFPMLAPGKVDGDAVDAAVLGLAYIRRRAFEKRVKA